MKKDLSFWLHLVGLLAPVALSSFGGKSAIIAPYVSGAIQSAETIPGADGPTKLAAAVSIASAGLQAAQAAGAHSGVIVTASQLTDAVNVVVSQANAAHAGLAAPATS